LPDKKYDPMALDPRKGVYSVNLKTLLGVGIPLSTFLMGTTLGHLATIEERRDRGFIAEEGWEKNVRRVNRMEGGKVEYDNSLPDIFEEDK
jgi:hypothetical protein